MAKTKGAQWGMCGGVSQSDIKRELSVTELISKTFELYREGFTKYLLLFIVVEAIVGGVTAIARHAFILPTVPTNATPDDLMAWAPGFFGALIRLVASIGIVSILFVPIAQGGAIKLASDQIEKGQAELAGAIKFVASKLLQLWGLCIIVGLVVCLGVMVLVIPGIIAGIMFALAFPILLLEDKGILDSMGRSRELVRHRWLKTLATYLILGIAVTIASFIVSAITEPFGVASPLLNGIISALYQPLFPILLAVYYYSNLARITPVPSGQTPATTTMPIAGTKFCFNCGTQLPSSIKFCSQCGAKQPPQT